jgi:hypothetical protein
LCKWRRERKTESLRSCNSSPLPLEKADSQFRCPIKGRRGRKDTFIFCPFFLRSSDLTSSMKENLFKANSQSDLISTFFTHVSHGI